MAPAIHRAAPLFLATMLVSGCINTYLEQKADLRSGAPAREAQANQRLAAAQSQQASLQDEQVSLQRDIERNERKLASAQDGLGKVNRDLANARKQNRISDGDYKKLKAQADKLQQEINEIDFQMQGGAGNAAEVEAKRRQLDELERRKAELEKALKLSAGS